jgi:adenosylhomocysteinase
MATATSRKGEHMTLPIDPKLDHKVADMSLADWGSKEMQLSEREMPGLMALIEKYGARSRFRGCA